MDALPDLSEVQVIVKAQFPGQSPRDVEDQLTYPLSASLLAVPGVKDVRAFSFYGDAFLYALFEEGTDPYWARSRVGEVLAEAQSRLPPSATASLGPDASALGWVLAYALVDETGKQDLTTLRRFQEEFLRYELQSLSRVADVAVVGGYEDVMEVIANSERLAAQNLSLEQLVSAVRSASFEQGASLMELGEREFLIRTDGRLDDLEALAALPLRVTRAQGDVRVGDVAGVQRGVAARRGIAELNGEGEVVGAFVIMRQGADVLATIDAAKARLGALEGSLPPGAEIRLTPALCPHPTLRRHALGAPGKGAAHCHLGARPIPPPLAPPWGYSGERAPGVFGNLPIASRSGDHAQCHGPRRPRRRHRRHGGCRHCPHRPRSTALRYLGTPRRRASAVECGARNGL